MSKINYEQLVALAKAGDESAMTKILESSKGLVKSQARAFFITGGDEDDLVQEGMIALHKAILGYSEDKGAAFLSYATMCVRSRLKDVVRKYDSKKSAPLSHYLSIDPTGREDDEGNIVSTLEAEGSNPEGIYLEREAYVAFWKRIRGTLQTTDYEILKLYLKGLTYTDIAKCVDLTLKQVDNALQRIKRRVKKLIYKSAKQTTK